MTYEYDYEQLISSIEAVFDEDISCQTRLSEIYKQLHVFRASQKSTNKPPSIKKIVSDYFDTDINLINSTTRKEQIREIRQIAMWEYFYHSRQSLERIGIEFYDGAHVFNHATVLHAVSHIDEIRSVDRRFREMTDDISKKVEIYYSKRNRIIKRKKDGKSNLSNTEAVSIGCTASLGN